MSRPSTSLVRYRNALAGNEPAETLPTRERELLVAELHARKWTDREVAAHCRMTTYTAARIRTRLGLPLNFDEYKEGAV
jgi:hypothetical protein